MANRKRASLVIGFSLLLFTVAISTVAFLAGIDVAANNTWPTSQVLSLKKRFNRLIGVSNDPARPETIETAYFSINIRWQDIPKGRAGIGGGLTSFYEDVILLTHDGRFYSVGGESPVFLESLEPPSNNFANFVAASSSAKYAHLNHDTSRLRFNDILFINDQEFAGFVLSYTEWNSTLECYSTAVATLHTPLDARNIQSIRALSSDWRVVFRTSPCLPLEEGTRALEGHMAGGRIASQGNGKVVLGSGDYHWDGLDKPIAYAQQDDADYGKTIEIDLISGASRQLSKGQRNIQGIVVTDTGTIWTTEHGPRGGDELNKIIAGENYGWPLTTFGINYDGTAINGEQNIGRHLVFKAPVFAWTPSIATSNLTQIKGFHPAWDGDLLVATLKDQALYRIRLSDQDTVTTVEPIRGLGRRMRYVHMHLSSQIFIWFDNSQIAVLQPESKSDAKDKLEQLIQLYAPDNEDSRKLKGLIEACLMCHSLDKKGPEQLPPLTHMYGVSYASSPGYSYSPALLKLNGSWGAESLKEYILEPESLAPGTYMPKPGVTEKDALTITEFLRAIAVKADGASAN